MLGHLESYTKPAYVFFHFTRVSLAAFGSLLGPIECHLEAMVGLCWPCYVGLCWRLSGLEFQPQREHGSVEVEFWVGFGLMLGHLEAMLGLCCAIFRPCWNQIWQPASHGYWNKFGPSPEV